MGKLDYTLKDVQNLVKKADKNGDGKVVREEFHDMMVEYLQKQKTEQKFDVEPKEAASEQEYNNAMRAFKMFDKNEDGIIDINELKEAMKTLDLEQDPDKVEQLFKDLDKNGMGPLTT